MAKRQLNPFIYGKPVQPARFIGREEALDTIFGRIFNGESTAVVGEPHVGKSFLLCYIAVEEVKADWLGQVAQQSIFIEIDCHLLPQSYQPTDLWQYVLTQVEKSFTDETIQEQLEAVRRGAFGSQTLVRLFRLLAQKSWRVVLLIDEFDVLLHHPNFNTAEFFGALRSLSTRTDGLVLVTASRLSVTEMNRRTEEIKPLGSPFFNNFIDVSLPPFHPTEVDILLDRTLEGTGVSFTQDDRAYIRRMAGRHPYLVQTVAAALFDAVTHKKVREERYDAANRTMQRRITAHFADLWRSLSPEAQTATVILVLAEMKGRVDGRDFDTGDLEMLDWYGPELDRLADSGLVERDDCKEWRSDQGNFAVWRGKRWRVTAGSFVWWVASNAIASTRKVLDFEQWLQDREFEGCLTRGQKKKFKELAGYIPKGVVTNAGEFLGTLLKGWLTSG